MDIGLSFTDFNFKQTRKGSLHWTRGRFRKLIICILISGAQLHSILVVHLMYSFKKMVAHDQAYRVNFQNIGGARAPDAPI